MGRSRGGLTTKIHALVDAEGRPIRIALTPGQAHDGTAAEELLAGLKSGAILLADKAYDSNAIREQAQDQDVWPTSHRSRTARARLSSAPFCIATETWWNASSTSSNNSAALPRDTTRTRTTSWLPSSWSQPASGSAVMSPRPRPLRASALAVSLEEFHGPSLS
jgi:transposase